jgi:hypothetical protein
MESLVNYLRKPVGERLAEGSEYFYDTGFVSEFSCMDTLSFLKYKENKYRIYEELDEK